MVRITKLQYKLLRDLKAAKFQFGAVIIIIMLGVAMFMGTYSAYLNLDMSYNESYERLSMADYWLTVDYIEERAAAEIGAIPGVTAQGRIVADIQIDMLKETGERIAGRVISLPPDARPDLIDLQINSGSYFSAISGREILVEKHFADYHQLGPGDWLTLSRNGGKARYQVAGVVTSPEYIWVAKSAQEPMPTPRTFGVLYMTLPTAEKLFEMDGIINEINFSVEPGTDREAVVAEVKNILRRHNINRVTMKDDPVSISTRKIDIVRGVRTAYLVELDDQIGNKLLTQDLKGFQQLAYLFPLLFISMACLTIYVLLGRLVESQRVQIGLMRGLGFSRPAVLWHYLGFALFVGLAGSLLGLILGEFMGRGLTGLYATQLNLPFISVKTRWDIVLISIIIGTVIPMLAGFLPAWSTMKLQPAVAMRPAPPSAGHRTLIEIILPFLKHLPYIVKLPLRNIFRNTRRSLFMALGIASAVIMVIVSMSFVDAMQSLLDTQFSYIQRYDALVHFQGNGASSTATYAANLEGVEKAEPLLEAAYRVRFGGESLDSSIMGLPPDSSLYRLLSTDGEPINVNENGILLPSGFEKRLGAKVGDTIILEPLVGTVGQTEKRLDGYVNIYFGGSAYMPIREVQKITRQYGEISGIMVQFEGEPSSTLLDKLYNIPKAASIEFRSDFQKLLDEQMSFFWVFIGVMLAMGTALGAAIIFNSVTVNVLQRLREIALMRAVGLKAGMLNAMFTIENLAIGAVGVLMGIPGGRFIAEYYMSAMGSGSEETASMPLVIFPRTYIIAACFALVILIVSQLPALRQVNRLSLSTAIKDWYE